LSIKTGTGTGPFELRDPRSVAEKEIEVRKVNPKFFSNESIHRETFDA